MVAYHSTFLFPTRYITQWIDFRHCSNQFTNGIQSTELLIEWTNPRQWLSRLRRALDGYDCVPWRCTNKSSRYFPSRRSLAQSQNTETAAVRRISSKNVIGSSDALRAVKKYTWTFLLSLSLNRSFELTDRHESWRAAADVTWAWTSNVSSANLPTKQSRTTNSHSKLRTPLTAGLWDSNGQ